MRITIATQALLTLCLVLLIQIQLHIYIKPSFFEPKIQFVLLFY